MQTAKQIAADLFKSYPDVDTFFVTSDGQAFYESGNAIAHSSSLKDKNVTTVRRDGDIDEAGIDLTTKVVYLDSESEDQIEAAKEIETVKVVVTEVSPSEKEALANSGDAEKEVISTASEVGTETASTASEVGTETASTASEVGTETASTASEVGTETASTASETGTEKKKLKAPVKKAPAKKAAAKVKKTAAK